MYSRLVLVLVLASAPALAQPVPPSRIKANLVAIDGNILTLRPMPEGNAKPAADAPTRTVTLTAETRYVESRKGSFAAIKPGDYAGAAVTVGRSNLRATEVFVYDDALRGTGEGRFTDRGRILVNGTVKTVQPGSKDANDGTVTLHYRGAALEPQAGGKSVCFGRAVPAPFASALSCEADAVVEISSGTPVSALTMGDRSLLVPGSVVTVTIVRIGDRETVPGIIVEKPQSNP